MISFYDFVSKKYCISIQEAAGRVYVYDPIKNPEDHINFRTIYVTSRGRKAAAETIKSSARYKEQLISGGIPVNPKQHINGKGFMLRYGEVSPTQERKLKAEYDARRIVDIPERKSLTTDAIKNASSKAKITLDTLRDLWDKVRRQKK